MVNVAVIGTGNMGKHHARVYSELGCNLVAVSDLNEGAGREVSERLGCRFYREYREMLEKEDICAVSVAVPTKFHREVVLECIGKWKHVLVEKPIADSIENAREMVEAARKAGVKLAVGHTERFNPAVQKLKEMVDKGDLGNVTSLVAKRVGVFPPQIRDANVIIDLAVHDIDVFNYLLNKRPVKGYVMAGRALTSQREDYADIMLKYDGAVAFIQVNWITPVKIRNLSVTGTKGYVELNYITQELTMYRSGYRKIDSFSDVVEFGTPEKVMVNIEKVEPLKVELRNFLDSIQGKESGVVTAEEGMAALDIALKAMNSFKE